MFSSSFNVTARSSELAAQPQKTRFQPIFLDGTDIEYRSALLKKENFFNSVFSISSLIIIGRSSLGGLRLVRRAAFKIR